MAVAKKPAARKSATAAKPEAKSEKAPKASVATTPQKAAKPRAAAKSTAPKSAARKPASPKPATRKAAAPKPAARKPAAKAATAKSGAASPRRRTGLISAISVGLVAAGSLTALFGRKLLGPGNAAHRAPDLAMDQPHPDEHHRAPDAFRPDPTAPVPASEREVMRPATLPVDSQTAH